MNIVPIAPHVTAISFGIVSVFLLDFDELTLIDTGVAGSAPSILEGIRAAGRQPDDLKHILLSHLHVDHVGSAKALQTATGAQIDMHPVDAEAFQAGQTMREVRPGPGALNRLIHAAMRLRPIGEHAEPACVDQPLSDGQVLAFAGGLRVIHAPGHTAGHVAFLLPQSGGILFAGDACTNMTRLGYSILYEDIDQGRRTLRKLSEMEFETAVFSHGRPLKNGAHEFRRKWGAV